MYAGPQNDEFLPVALAGVHPGSAQLGDEVAGGGTEITDIHVFAMWFSISRFSSDYGFQQSAMIPWRAVEGVDDDGEFDGSRGWYEPRPMNVYSTYGPDGAGKEDDGSTIWADWMSCCSPMYLCTEMFYSWVLANGVLGFAACALASLALLFQLMMVDFACASPHPPSPPKPTVGPWVAEPPPPFYWRRVNNNFLANIPATSLWSDWWEDDTQVWRQSPDGLPKRAAIHQLTAPTIVVYGQDLLALWPDDGLHSGYWCSIRYDGDESDRIRSLPEVPAQVPRSPVPPPHHHHTRQHRHFQPATTPLPRAPPPAPAATRVDRFEVALRSGTRARPMPTR